MKINAPKNRTYDRLDFSNTINVYISEEIKENKRKNKIKNKDFIFFLKGFILKNKKLKNKNEIIIIKTTLGSIL